MSNEELGAVVTALLLLLIAANLLGQLFARLHQPRVVGEIVAGILLGPTLLGEFAPATSAAIFGATEGDPSSIVLGFMYHLGLLLLMFVSGFSVRHVLGRENRRPTAWILGVGTPLPFLMVLGISPWLPIEMLVGEAGSRSAVVLVLAIATAVTSIPVISKIFHDLGILDTRFASLVLGAAVLQDILLWGVLSIATAIAAASLVATQGDLAGAVTGHVAATLLYTLCGLVVAPPVLRRLGRARWNVLVSHSPITWMMIVLLAYVAAAAVLDVTMIFGAFLAGFGIVGGLRGTERPRYNDAFHSIEHLAAGVFIPIYFAVVGYRLNLRTSFDPAMTLVFLTATSLVVLISIGFAARLAGFRGRDLVNLAVTCNARGGPGIVLASVAFDAGIINAPFFTTLVIAAVLTSQACGFWLDHVLRKGWPLLSGVDLRPGRATPGRVDGPVTSEPVARPTVTPSS